MLLLGIAIAPALAICMLVYVWDKHDKEPIKLLLKCFVAGMFSCIPAVVLSLLMEGALGVDKTQGSLETLVYAFCVVAFSEELSKFYMVRRYAFFNGAFNEPYDGIIYSVMVSMGFATVENIMYTFDYGIGTGIMRMFTAVPAHATFAVIMGYYLGLAKFRPERRVQFYLLGIGGAILFHGAYDYFLFDAKENRVWVALGAAVSLAVGLYLSIKAIRIHQYGSPFRIRAKKHTEPFN